MPDLLNLMVDSGAADLHVRVGIPPCYRDGGTLKRVEGPPCEQEDVEYLVKAIANDDEVQNIRTQGGADFGFAFGTKARFRVSAFKERGNMALVLRQIPNELLPLDVIGLDPGLVDRLLSTPRGMILVTGPTGSGKSTLMSMLLRLYNPDGGAVFINDTELNQMSTQDVRANISIALQQNILFATSVAENIRYGMRDVDDAQVIAAAKVACADEFICTLADGYDTELGERGSKLSTGQRQRISIARAIVRDTPILILDEPTASLDPETGDFVRSFIEKISREKKMSILLASHNMDEVKRLCKNVLMMNNGVIIDKGTPDELIKKHGKRNLEEVFLKLNRNNHELK